MCAQVAQVITTNSLCSTADTVFLWALQHSTCQHLVAVLVDGHSQWKGADAVAAASPDPPNSQPTIGACPYSHGIYDWRVVFLQNLHACIHRLGMVLHDTVFTCSGRRTQFGKEICITFNLPQHATLMVSLHLLMSQSNTSWP